MGYEGPKGRFLFPNFFASLSAQTPPFRSRRAGSADKSTSKNSIISDCKKEKCAGEWDTISALTIMTGLNTKPGHDGRTRQSASPA